MQVTGKHTAQAHLWLYESGIDPDLKDVSGRDLASSLALVLARAERDGQMAALAHYLKRPESGEREITLPVATAETTGKYDTRQLDALLEKCG